MSIREEVHASASQNIPSAKILAISNNVGMYVGQYYKKEYRL